MNIPDIIKLYTERKNQFELLKNTAYKIIYEQLKMRGIKFRLDERIKELNKLIEKSKRKEMANPFTEMTDIVGLRVVYLFQGDLETIKGVIRNNFRVIKEDDKPSYIANYIFDYAVPHFDVKLPKKFNKQDIGDMTFEVQVHTICQDAWAALSHPFYKEEAQIPSKLEKDFYALNGLFYVADTHFEMLRPLIVNKIF
jgi:putative GTP pyrophosphokinase